MSIKKQVCGAICIVLFLFFANSLYAQNSDPGVLGKVNIASPNAASLGKYIDIPVSKHTGIPGVNIPVYTVDEGSISVPISLSYHAGGLKLGEMASWVGSGWSLNAGGVITRTVRGTPDEQSTSEFGKNQKGHLSNNGYNNYLFKTNPSSPLPSHDAIFLNDVSNGIADGEPDLFFFNFCGQSGKFYFNDDGIPVLLPESDYKIEYDYPTGTGVPKSIQKFTITIPDGTKYSFGVTDATNDTDPIEKTHNYYYGTDGLFYSGTNNTIVSWYLNKIQTADGLFSVNFSYTPEQYSYRTINGVSKVSGDYQYTSGANWKENGHWVQGVRLTGITTSGNNCVVTFEPGPPRQDLNEWSAAGTFSDVVNTDAKCLGAIQVSNSYGLCKKYRFTYDYFNSDAAGFPGANAFTDQKRLKLNQLKEESCDGTVQIPAHIFEYFTEPMPRRLSFAQDHWGFINGKTDNLNLTPGFIEKQGPNGIIKEIPGADRESYWPAMRAGALKKITYPTGGYTEFEFEPNTTWLSYSRYSKQMRYTFSMGYDGNNTPVTQTYTFSNNPYSVKLTNTPVGGTASFVGPSLTVGANEGTVAYSQGIPGAGTYQVSLHKPDTRPGNGTYVNIFEWVPEQVTENRIVGGMRIKRILHNEGTGDADLVTEYSYDESNGHSSGHLYSKPTYVQIVRNDYLRDAGIEVISQPGTNYCSAEGYEFCTTTGAPLSGPYLISPTSLRPMETTQGNHIGYNEVKVLSAGNGYTVYRYYGSNTWDQDTKDVANRIVELGYVPSAPAPNFPAPPPVTDFKRGQIKYEGYFNQSGQLLKENYFYYEYTDNPLRTPAVITASGTYYAGLPTFYDLYSSKLTKTTAQERIFQSPTIFSENTTDSYFESNLHNQPTRKYTTNSKGQVVESKSKYASDLVPVSCTTLTDGYSAYQAACVSCLTQYNQSRVATGHSTAFWKYWDYQALLKCRSQARISFYMARKNYFNPSIAGSYSNCLNTAKGSADVNLKPIFELRDKFINAPVEITTWKGGNLISALYTSFGYSSSLPGMIYPTKARKINFSSIAAIFSPVSINGSTLTSDSRYEDEASIKIEGGNIVESVAKDGVATSYIWGYSNTLPVVKAVAVTYSTLKSAYDAVAGNLSTLRSQPGLAAAMVSTYVYKPGVGMLSETDPRGRTIYYEYDKMNRLSLLRDHDNNIIKKICYNYYGQAESCPVVSNLLPSWWVTGATRCKPCPANNNYITNMLQREEKDINPQSPTYNTIRWTDIGVSTTCDVNPDWQFTATAIRCKLNLGLNTGEQEREQKDMNPCSTSYGQTRWIVVGVNYTACPLSTCNSNTCTGEDKKCINGVCQTGTKVYTASVYSTKAGYWICTYHYVWSDGSVGRDLQETSPTNCLGSSTD